jgi:hypothetical protein
MKKKWRLKKKYIEPASESINRNNRIYGFITLLLVVVMMGLIMAVFLIPESKLQNTPADQQNYQTENNRRGN